MENVFIVRKKKILNESYNYLVSSSKGLEDSSLTFVPTVKVGQTLGTATKEVSPIIIQKTGQVYDDVTLRTITQFNNLAPNLTSKYLVNPSAYSQGIDDIVNSILPGIPANTKIGVSAFGVYEMYNRDIQ